MTRRWRRNKVLARAGRRAQAWPRTCCVKNKGALPCREPCAKYQQGRTAVRRYEVPRRALALAQDSQDEAVRP